ncbi:hypothetical protein D9615_006699 [Tricholomella constricta]|uniref:Uncharacterized protein n=1 Tax=Tricholomella constricta TaxID=117010 RepID=A0A8H5H7A0_9AGAR|nr:hypothetical protein D9615_006699 [Tricholomella constricta]
MAAVAAYPSAITFASKNVVSEPDGKSFADLGTPEADADDVPAALSLAVIANLQFLLENIEVFDICEGEKGYILHPPKGTRLAAGPINYKIAIGPLEIDLTIDLSTFSVSLKIILKVPILGGVTIANVVGNLKDGIEVKVGYPGLLGGIVGVKLDANSDVVLSWDFTAFGKGFQGSKVLFHI